MNTIQKLVIKNPNLIIKDKNLLQIDYLIQLETSNFKAIHKYIKK